MSYGRIPDRRSRVGVEGFEPPTSCSQSKCATRLRYTPSCSDPGERNCITAPSLLRRRFGRRWWLLFAPGRRLEQRLSRKAHASLVVGLENLHLHDLAFLEVVGHVV